MRASSSVSVVCFRFFRRCRVKTASAALFLFITFFLTIPVSPQMNSSAETEIRSVMAQLLKASLDGDSDKVASLLTTNTSRPISLDTSRTRPLG